jgi:hypothetical protein
LICRAFDLERAAAARGGLSAYGARRTTTQEVGFPQENQVASVNLPHEMR